MSYISKKAKSSFDNGPLGEGALGLTAVGTALEGANGPADRFKVTGRGLAFDNGAEGGGPIPNAPRWTG